MEGLILASKFRVMRTLLIVFMLLLSQQLLAQRKLSSLGVAGDIGTFANHKAGGFIGGTSFFAHYKSHHAELGLHALKGYKPNALPNEDYRILSALYGRSLFNTKDKLLGFAGFGIVNGTTKGDFWFDNYIPSGLVSSARTVRYYYKETVWMPALMIKAEGRFSLAQIVDVRTALYANLTYKVPSFCLQLGFGFGKVREKK